MDKFSESEVKNFHLALGGHQDVLRLDVTVDDAASLRGRKRAQNLLRQIEDLIEFEFALTQQ